MGMRDILQINNSDDYVAVARQAPEGYIGNELALSLSHMLTEYITYCCMDVLSLLIPKLFGVGVKRVDMDPPIFCTPGHEMVGFSVVKPCSDAPSLTLPRNVGFSVGHAGDGIKYFVMQVHYAQPFAGDVKDFSGVTLHMTHKKPQNLAMVLLFVSGESIPPGRNQVQINTTCEYNGDIELHPFAFRTHTHAMGRVVSAFYKHEGQWTKIGVRNPQWPQLFLPLKVIFVQNR
ncbi:copper type II ascorbate-dependent monooxygenase domain protein [Ancylostoma duodenale]|uniref:Copper type II ascorbate-dependent monooxygenase domain protein n=1 Tax=Ancylostoma duodenale TaxID=51022 RepID=A0A0C2GKE2_9BILA|nr:copper type II ascorbate-dependent monooxygenase domain protein [Ancylostoma duodenale]